MTAALHRAGLRHWAGHPWQAVLSVLGIALGVAVVVAVDLANQSARRAFDLSLETLTGRATHQIVAGPAGLDESHYARLRLSGLAPASAPLVEGHVQLRGETLRLLGVDPLAEGAIRSYGEGLQGERVTRLITEPGALLVTTPMADRLGLGVGADLELEINGLPARGRIVGLLPVEGREAAALDGLLLADIATAQELLGRLGRLDRIDLRLADADARRAVEAWLPPGLRLVESASAGAGQRALTRAFHINLTAMSLLALVVGGFLIYNTMTFSVLQRRGELGTWRLLGVTRGELAAAVLAQALWIGGLGSLLGLALGLALAEALLGLVTRTINDLYFVLTVTALQPAVIDLAKGFALGLFTSALAALGPAIEAGRVSPLAAQRRSVLEQHSHRLLPWLTTAGIALLVAGLGLSALPLGGLLLGFASLFLIIVGFSLLAPLTVLVAARVLRPPLDRLLGALGGLAARGLGTSLSRTGLAVAALAVAVSATVGVGVMVESLRATVADWLGQTLRGDIYVSAPSSVSSQASGTLEAGVEERLRQVPGIAAFSSGRSVTIEAQGGPLELLALQMAPASYQGIRFQRGEAAAIWPRFDAGEGILVSEPLAYHRGLSPGDPLLLQTDRGPVALPVLGVFYDYASPQGMAILPRALYERLWDDRGVSSLGLYLAPGADRAAAVAAVRLSLADLDQRLLVRSNADIREASLAIFDRTFAITHVLRLLVVGVAFVGVLSALLALQLERAREHAVLRATGVTPAGLLGLVTLQTGLLGLLAGLLALPLGLVMAQALIEVINLRAFGWSIQTHWPATVLLEALALAVGAALLAGLYPGLRIGRVRPAAALREE